jgi:hypothetical protein
LEDILLSTWIPSINIINIFEKLEIFTKEYYKTIKENNIVFVGKYYIGDIYYERLLRYLPVGK